MFYRGKTYQVRKSTNNFVLAMEEWIDTYVRQSVAFTEFVVKHLVPDFDEPVTEDNQAEVLRAVYLFQSDRERARILDVKRFQEWQRAQAEAGQNPTEDVGR